MFINQETVFVNLHGKLTKSNNQASIEGIRLRISPRRYQTKEAEGVYTGKTKEVV